MFLPYLADVSMRRWPVGNWVLMGLTTIITFTLFGPLDNWHEQVARHYLRSFNSDAASLPAAEGALRFFLLQPHHFNPFQLVGCTFAHGGVMHLVGNMLFLWVFGNAVNARFGHAWFFAFYFAAAIFEGLIYVLFSHTPSLGASGAIMGVVGAFVVLYPTCDIRVFWLFWFGLAGRAGAGALSAMWLVAIYIAFDIWGLIRQNAGVAYLSHIAGFAFGFGLMWILIRRGVIVSEHNEKNLLQVWGLQKLSAEQEEAFGLTPWKDQNVHAGTVPPVVIRPAAGKTTTTRRRDNGPISLD